MQLTPLPHPGLCPEPTDLRPCWEMKLFFTGSSHPDGALHQPAVPCIPVVSLRFARSVQSQLAAGKASSPVIEAGFGNSFR